MFNFLPLGTLDRTELLVQCHHVVQVLDPLLRIRQCPFVMNRASPQILVTGFCCENLFPLVLDIFVISFARSSIEGVSVIVNKFADANNGTDCSANTGLPVLV